MEENLSAFRTVRNINFSFGDMLPWFTIVCLAFAHSSILPQSRVVDLAPPAPDEDRQEYDHQAFLGKDQVKYFENLSPEESKQRLGIIYDKIDQDGDGMVTSKELEEWIEYVQLRFIKRNVESQWVNYKGHENGSLRWGHYKEKTYGQLADESDETVNKKFRFASHLKRDRKRWDKADQDNDGYLTIEEFTDFLHPEESNFMKDLVIEETIEDIDKDNDGKISKAEYLKDLWPEDGKEPDWLADEKDNFDKHRDKNADGFLDKEEVKAWILPDGYNHIVAETNHLIYASDENRDGVLSREEVLNNFEVFVGSQATDFGEAIRNHDEF